MDNNDNDNDNDGSLGSDLALVTMGGGGVDDDMIAKQIESLRRSAVDLTKEQDGARQLAKKYAAESREWEGRYQRVNKQLEDRERDLLEIKTDVEKCMQMKTFFEEKFRMADAVISQCVDEVSTTKRLHERHTEDSVKNWERVQKDHTERCARTEQQLTEVTRRLEITDGEKRVALESSESLSQECKELTAKLHATELKMHETVQKYEKELTELKQEEKRLESMITHKHTEVERGTEALFALKDKHSELQTKHGALTAEVEALRTASEAEVERLKGRADAADAARERLRDEIEQMRTSLSEVTKERDLNAQRVDALTCDLDMARSEHATALAQAEEDREAAVTAAAAKETEHGQVLGEEVGKLSAQVVSLERELAETRLSVDTEVRRKTSELAEQNRVQIEQLQKRNDAEMREASNALAEAKQHAENLEQVVGELKRDLRAATTTGAARVAGGSHHRSLHNHHQQTVRASSKKPTSILTTGGGDGDGGAGGTGLRSTKPPPPPLTTTTNTKKKGAAAAAIDGGAVSSKHLPTMSAGTFGQPAPSSSTFGTFARRKKKSTASGGIGGAPTTTAKAKKAAHAAARRETVAAAWPESPPHDPFFDF